MQLLPIIRRGYGIAILTTAAAFLATLFVGVWSERSALALYLWAVVVSAYFGGLRVGLSAVVLALFVLLGQHQLVPNASPLRQQGDVVPLLLLFGLVGTLAAYLSHACARALTAASRMKHTIGHMQDAVVLTDAGGRITYLNRAARVLCGRQEAEALGQPFSWVFTLLDPKSQRALDDPAVQVLGPGRAPLTAAPAILRSRHAPETAVELSAEPLRAQRAVPYGTLLVLRPTRASEEPAPGAADPLHAVAASSPLGMIVLDASGQCVYSNPACRAVAGVAPDESLGDGWTRFVYPEDQEFAAEWQQAVRQEKPFATEVRFKGDDGRLRWTQLRAAPLRDEDGRYLGQVGLLEDITLWKELEDDLSLQQKETEDLRRGHRAQVEEMEGRLASLQKAETLFHEQLAEKEQAEQRLRRRHEEERAEWHHTEERLLRENGELRRAREALEEKLAEQQDGGAAREELARLRAEAKRTEDKLKHDLKEQRRTRQAAEEALAELRRAEEARRGDLERLQAEAGQGREKLRKELADLTETNQLLEAELTDWQDKERQARATGDHLQRERDAAYAQLEEARHTAQEERERWHREQAERAERGQRNADWLDRVGERMQPLAADLNGAMRTWRRSGDPTPLEQQVRQVTLFADGLWAAGRLGRQALLFRTEPTELGPLVERVVTAAAPLVQARGHFLTVKLPLAPEWLTVDPARTEQALIALLDNAARFSEPGSQIELTAERQGDELVFHVKDTGHGITPEKLREVEALDARQRRFGNGLGLGLALVRGLVEEQGGRLDMVSEGEGCGSAFQVRLPVRSEALPLAELCDEAA